MGSGEEAVLSRATGEKLKGPYRDFTGKPTPEFVLTEVQDHPRVWLMLMNNGPAEKPDPTTIMLTQVLPESLPRVERWQFPKVEIRLYSRR